MGEPRTNYELFLLLERAAWIDSELALAMRKAVGFRNVIVQGYAGVDLAIVRDIVEHHLGDLLAFVQAVRARLNASA